MISPSVSTFFGISRVSVSGALKVLRASMTSCVSGSRASSRISRALSHSETTMLVRTSMCSYL